MKTETITIQQPEFQDALDELFAKYGVTSTDILDYNAVDGGFQFELSRVPDVELKLRAEVDSIINSNNFMDSDIAFICSDGKVHTPEGATLFARVYNMLVAEIKPIVGYANMIDASNDLAAIEKESGPVLYEDLILTKESDMLKGTKVSRVASSRTKNARNMDDPVMAIEMDLRNPEKLAQFMNNASEKLKFATEVLPEVHNGSIRIILTGKCPMEALNLIFKLAPNLVGVKDITIVGADGDYKHKIKL